MQMYKMDKAYLEKFDVINRYNQNRLSDEELNRFEVYILEHPEIIPVIEKDRVIREAYQENKSLLQEATGEKDAFPWVRGMAMAACLVIAVVVVLNIERGEQNALRPPVILETFRGAGDTAIQLSGEPVVQFQIDMGPAEFLESDVFTAELVNTSGSSLFVEPGLTVDVDGWLFYSLTGQMQPLSGSHQVRVYAQGSEDAATTYNVIFESP